MRTPKAVIKFLENPWLRGGTVLAIIVAIALLKIANSEITFSFLYLFPITLSTWWFNWKKGMFIAVACVAISWVMGIELGYLTPSAVHWNSFLRLLIFLGLVVLLQMFRWELERQMLLADTDPHTNILNIRGFYEKAQKSLDEAVEKKAPVSLLYIDLDNFKAMNDRYGHLEGDRVLQTVAVAMRAYFRSQDLVGRFGGDEFLAFLSGVPPQEVERRVNDFRQHLNGRMQSENWPVTFSMGCVIYLEPPGSLERLVRSADDLAYEVKDSGRNGLKIKIY